MAINLKQLEADIKEIEELIENPETDDATRNVMKSALQTAKKELADLKTESVKKPSTESKEVKKTTKEPKSSSSTKGSSSLAKCQELLAKYKHERTVSKARIDKRKKAGKPVELTPSETITKTAKVVGKKVEAIKEDDKQLTEQQKTAMINGIVATVKNTLKGILSASDKSSFIADLVKEINALKSDSYAKGGSTKDEPKVVRGFFDDEEYEYEEGGNTTKRRAFEDYGMWQSTDSYKKDLELLKKRRANATTERDKFMAEKRIDEVLAILKSRKNLKDGSEMSDGGYMAHGGATHTDLFQDYENMPPEVAEVFNYYGGYDVQEMDYDQLKEMLNAFENVGYTFDYGLDGEPYGLRPMGVEITELEGYEDEYAKGGSTKDEPKVVRGFFDDEEYEYDNGGMMAKGGAVRGGKFQVGDKVMINDSGYVRFFSEFDLSKPATILEVRKVKTSKGIVYTYSVQLADGKKPFNSAMESQLTLAESKMSYGGYMAKGGSVSKRWTVNFIHARNGSPLRASVLAKSEAEAEAEAFKQIAIDGEEADNFIVETVYVSEGFDKSNGRMMADGGETKGKYGYVAFYKGKRIEVYADTMYAAQLKAAKIFNAKKSYDVNVVLAEVDGKPYINSTMFSDGGMMAYGGVSKDSKHYEASYKMQGISSLIKFSAKSDREAIKLATTKLKRPNAELLNIYLVEGDKYTIIYGDSWESIRDTPNMANGGMMAYGGLLEQVSEDWGRDSDFYSELEEAIVGWSDRNGELTPKGKIAIKKILINYDSLEDYEQFLEDDKMAKGGLAKHGLKSGDVIVDGMLNTAFVYNRDRKLDYSVDLDKGERREIGELYHPPHFYELANGGMMAKGGYMAHGGETNGINIHDMVEWKAKSPKTMKVERFVGEVIGSDGKSAEIKYYVEDKFFKTKVSLENLKKIKSA